MWGNKQINCRPERGPTYKKLKLKWEAVTFQDWVIGKYYAFGKIYKKNHSVNRKKYTF